MLKWENVNVVTYAYNADPVDETVDLVKRWAGPGKVELSPAGLHF